MHIDKNALRTLLSARLLLLIFAVLLATVGSADEPPQIECEVVPRSITFSGSEIGEYFSKNQKSAGLYICKDTFYGTATSASRITGPVYQFGLLYFDLNPLNSEEFAKFNPQPPEFTGNGFDRFLVCISRQCSLDKRESYFIVRGVEEPQLQETASQIISLLNGSLDLTNTRGGDEYEAILKNLEEFEIFFELDPNQEVGNLLLLRDGVLHWVVIFESKDGGIFTPTKLIKF